MGDSFVVDCLEHSERPDVQAVTFIKSRIVSDEHTSDGDAVGIGNELSRVPVLIKGMSAGIDEFLALE